MKRLIAQRFARVSWMIAVMMIGTPLAGHAAQEVAAWSWWNLSSNTNVPIGLSNVVAIAAGASHSVALTADGRVVAWGRGSATGVPTGLSNVVAIAAGNTHNVALMAEGRVVAWGCDDYGGTNLTSGLSNVVAIAAG
jgi:alpha-tubulin suppressor-like RCC1 family protein